jgi:hypothetical protein
METSAAQQFFHPEIEGQQDCYFSGRAPTSSSAGHPPSAGQRSADHIQARGGGRG